VVGMIILKWNERRGNYEGGCHGIRGKEFRGLYDLTRCDTIGNEIYRFYVKEEMMIHLKVKE